MTSPLKSVALLFVPALAGSALAATLPGRSRGRRGPRRRPVPGRSASPLPGRGRSAAQRIADISGNSRRTRVTMFVTTDRRYSFECTAGADGRVLTASWNPPVDTRLANAAGGQAQAH